MPELVVRVDVDAPAAQVWDTLVDWRRQADWMMLTRVRATHNDGVGVGGGLEAFTGLGPIGFVDTMRITRWDPPRRCEVVHTGRVVRGTGWFEVAALSVGRSRLEWGENVDPPLGPVGRCGWSAVRPLLAWGLRRSLRQFAAGCAGAAR